MSSLPSQSDHQRGRLRTSLLVVATCLAAGAPGCGLFDGDDGPDTDDPAAVDLGHRTLTFTYDDAPMLATSLRIALDADGALGDVTWRLAEAPAGATASLSVADDGRSVTLSPDLAGPYLIAVNTAVDGAEATGETRFTVRPIYPYDLDAVVRDDPAAPLDTIIARVANQAWVFSIAGSEADLRAAVTAHPAVTPLGYDAVEGLLVTFDAASPEAAQALTALRATPGIDSVAHRVHEGENAPRADRIPDDGSRFDDSGDNWHLEMIHAPAAWDVTTGAAKLRVGVSDSGYDRSHEDLGGRFAEISTSAVHDHGTGVAAAIAARTDNQIGISGINWTSRLIAGDQGDLLALADKARLVNASWSMPGYVPASFDETDVDLAHARLEYAIACTRRYRNAARRAYRDTLFVMSAGNGIDNGLGNAQGAYGVPSRFNNGAIHVDPDGALHPLDNVVVVAAMVADGRLAFYSQFGDTVDIAAPTHFKSPKVGGSAYHDVAPFGVNSTLGGFAGTSAAAPVVTGVASLVWSVNPALEAREVKLILVESATAQVVERYTDPQGGVAALATPIPLVDAAAAVDAAQAPEVSITVDPVEGLGVGDFAFFSAKVEHGLGPFIHVWDFGDGKKSPLASDTHAFASAGVHTVKHTVIDLLGREAHAEVQVTVAEGGGDDDYVIWYTANVMCWGAPHIFITVRDAYEAEELASSFPGGGVDPNVLADKRLFHAAGFATADAARAWICPQITGWYFHYWCNRHYLIGDKPFQVGSLGCDLTNVPEVPLPQ